MSPVACFRSECVSVSTSVNPLPPAPPMAVRFGWFNHGHHAIDKGAIYRMPDQTPEDASWKKYLADHWLAIEAGNDLQDAYYDGPDHYINLANRGNLDTPEVGAVSGPPPRLSWAEMQAKMTPDTLHQFEKEWLQTPLTPDSMDKGPSLYNAIIETCGRLKNNFLRIAEGNQRLDVMTQDQGLISQEARKTYYEEIPRDIGRLNHLVADIFAPHVTPGTPDWELYPGSKEGMHAFLEGSVLNRRDYSTAVGFCKQKGSKIPVPHLPMSSVPYFVLDKMQGSFRQLFELVQIQGALLKSANPAEDDEGFKASLKEALKGPMRERLEHAQEAVSTVLYSLWAEAGKPMIPENPNPPQEPPQTKKQS